MSRFGPALDEEQRDLVAMLDAFVADHDVVLSDDADVVGGLATELAELGVWTIGTDERYGGGGAGRLTTAVAMERLGRAWPALGWAATQAHAAVDVLGGDDRFADVVAAVHTAAVAIAVVDATSPQVRLDWSADALSGSVDRIDPAAEAPYLLLLGDDDTAVLVGPEAMTTRPLERTGLGGALTRSVRLKDTVPAGAVHRMGNVDVGAARTRLRQGAAAVAAGIAGAAADAAAAYAAERHQFGGPLTELPTVRQSLLDQAMRTSVALAVAFAADERDGDGEGDRGDSGVGGVRGVGDGGGVEGSVRALAAVRHACDAAIEVAAAALQSHGGYGYLAEYPVERHLRDAVSLRAATDTQTATALTARTLVGLGPLREAEAS
ncbi:acyl-CoA dehydrogenase family protein [Streptosporangium sp. NPDC049046]|uniref:acyl-CoA dehydrogenase family protein n=1 Tax=Streptosporangium sp. NPDC049046 TaxID=3155031 RepID=UPI0034154E14